MQELHGGSFFMIEKKESWRNTPNPLSRMDL